MKKLLLIVSSLLLGGFAVAAPCLINLVPPTSLTQVCQDTNGNISFTDANNPPVTLSSLVSGQGLTADTVYPPVSITGITSATTINPAGATNLSLLGAGAVTIGGSACAISTTTAISGQYVILSDTSSVSTVSISTGTIACVFASKTPLVVNNVTVIELLFDATQSVWREIHD
jgi:hypothetical protein